MQLPARFLHISLLGALAVALGALGAHYLKNQIPGGLMTTDLVDSFDTGVKYHMYHTLAMFLIVVVQLNFKHSYLTWAYRFFFTGIVLFSGSVYLLSIRHLIGMAWLKFLGPITPLGGLFFIAGWLLIGLAVIKKVNSDNQA